MHPVASEEHVLFSNKLSLLVQCQMVDPFELCLLQSLAMRRRLFLSNGHWWDITQTRVEYLYIFINFVRLSEADLVRTNQVIHWKLSLDYFGNFDALQEVALPNNVHIIDLIFWLVNALVPYVGHFLEGLLDSVQHGRSPIPKKCQTLQEIVHSLLVLALNLLHILIVVFLVHRAKNCGTITAHLDGCLSSWWNLVIVSRLKRQLSKRLPNSHLLEWYEPLL